MSNQKVSYLVRNEMEGTAQKYDLNLDDEWNKDSENPGRFLLWQATLSMTD